MFIPLKKTINDIYRIINLKKNFFELKPYYPILISEDLLFIVISITSDEKRQIIDKYNATSHFYDKRYSKIQNEKFEIILKNYSNEDKIILDAGCGTGLLLEFILNHGYTKDFKFFSYVATDISWEMLKIFDSKLKNLIDTSFKNKINLILSDLENLPFRRERFHSIFAPTSLQNLPSIQKGITEMFKVAKDNAELKLTILKKKLDLEKLLTLLKSKIDLLEVLQKDNIEDVIIQGKVKKF
jgi:ubiquinone/menaquinone biosynthesis C-methylase UbiE